MAETLPFSQACENNCRPILSQLIPLLTTPSTVLEIGTGTGQHAEFFASKLPHLRWLPTDHPDNVWLCRQRLELADLPNIEAPTALNVSERPWHLAGFDHAYSANTAHIMSWKEVREMFAGVSEGLPVSGHFCLYGPFNYHGEFTSESNLQFDRYLRAQADYMGLRDMADLESLARDVGLVLRQDSAMPANNRLLVFERMP